MDLFTAKKLTSLRKYNSLSQEALAEKIGVSRQAVSKWERGEASPDTDNLLSISKLYGISMDDILGDKKAEIIIEELKNGTKTEDKTKLCEDTPSCEEVKNSTDDFNNIQEESTKTQNSKSSHFNKAGYFLMRFPYFLLIIIVYLVLGFTSSLWHPTWIIFLTIPAYYLTAYALKAPSPKKMLRRIPVYFYTIIIYILLGFTINFWHPGWLVFLAVPFYYWIISLKK